MPEKYRLTAQKILDFRSNRAELVSELESLRDSTGAADNESLIARQMRILAIEKLIADHDERIAALEAELIAEKTAKKRQIIIQTIVEIDRRAEAAGEKFLLKWLSENISVSDLSDMLSIRREIVELRERFHRQVLKLLPSMPRLQIENTSELEVSIDALLSELRASGCVLSVLRTEVFGDGRYPTNEPNAFILPDTIYAHWIRASLPMIDSIERQKKTALASNEQVSPAKTQQKFSEKIGETLKGIIPLPNFFFRK